ncbi:hypothetical protein ASG40_10305 [Methylobacterium sp. Leaf399]|uniref:AAA family ATPase n=1 Tax=Methylobacterium sp. Leaf399 TaxID=1736364 RepID=UPI0006FC12F0|nr:AAA family ATPase [Methylobacterium sp. Leaf399]KQT09045.1 hypothetical protein ASG40_10305 [Methylobacterium sp. Leaf399]
MTDSISNSASDAQAGTDTIGHLNFADKYRPSTFDEVFGQKSVVDCLSGLIERGRIGRCVLLHGAVGSGKTTLARIYARALNCKAEDPKSSPCYDCEACGASQADSILGFEEYNISRYGGGKETVERELKAFYGRDKVSRYRIMFFDEAHMLTKDACDLLLNHVEECRSDVVFLFATTEVERIREALRSRLFDLLVHPLAITDAIEFLYQAVVKEGIRHESGALELLAGLRKGYPRDLLLGLERVCDRRDCVLTVAQVRAAFDVDQTLVLVDYFKALADSDRDSDRDRPAEVVSAWQEAAPDKIRWIQAFLVHVYHNEILGRRLVVDGVIEAIAADVRADIVWSFCKRLGLTDPADLASYWVRLMNFWSSPVTEVHETVLSLRLTLFHRLAASTALDDAKEATGRGSRTGHATASASATARAALGPSSGFGPPPTPRPGARKVKDHNGYLTLYDVRQIVHAASFLAQEYGVLFNVAFKIRPALIGAREAHAAVTAIMAFRDDLAAQTRAWGGELIASITVLERDDQGMVGRIVAHLYAPNLQEPADADGAGQTGDWARAWRDGAKRLRGDAVVFEPAPAGARAALKFHWKQTLDLCAGLDEEVEAFDPTSGKHVSLLKLLRVKARRPGPVRDHPLVAIPAPLSDESIATACRSRLEPLSAFDDSAWGELTTGWELEEFPERRATRAERECRLAGVFQRFGEGTPEASAEVERIVGTWPSDPRRRQRRWRGWWAGRP